MSVANYGYGEAGDFYEKIADVKDEVDNSAQRIAKLEKQLGALKDVIKGIESQDNLEPATLTEVIYALAEWANNAE